MRVDIIILSNALNNLLLQLTRQTIETCQQSSKEIDFNFIVIEQQQIEYDYRNTKTYHINEPFNYNKFMNFGIENSNADYVCLCNNDLLFGKSWCENIIAAMENNNLLSASPYCQRSQSSFFRNSNDLEYGYSNGKHLSGWCIMCNRKLFSIIGKLDEDFPFWFADNAYAEQLKKYHIAHALIRKSLVTHKGQRTLHSMSKEMQNEYTMALAKKFIAKYPHNESAVYFSKFVK